VDLGRWRDGWSGCGWAEGGGGTSARGMVERLNVGSGACGGSSARCVETGEHGSIAWDLGRALVGGSSTAEAG